MKYFLLILFSFGIQARSIDPVVFEEAKKMAKKAACLAFNNPYKEGNKYPQYFYIFEEIHEAFETLERSMINTEGTRNNCSKEGVSAYTIHGRWHLCKSLANKSLMEIVQTMIHETVHLLNYGHSEEQTREIELSTMALSVGAYNYYKYKGIEVSDDLLPKRAKDLSTSSIGKQNKIMRRKLLKARCRLD